MTDEAKRQWWEAKDAERAAESLDQRSSANCEAVRKAQQRKAIIEWVGEIVG